MRVHERYSPQHHCPRPSAAIHRQPGVIYPLGKSNPSLLSEQFDADGDEDSPSNWAAPANTLEDHSFNPARVLEQQDWQLQQTESLSRALASLDERSRDILQQRWLTEDNKQTLHDLAAKYGISAERVRQLEKAAMKKLRTAIEI